MEGGSRSISGQKSNKMERLSTEGTIADTHLIINTLIYIFCKKRKISKIARRQKKIK